VFGCISARPDLARESDHVQCHGGKKKISAVVTRDEIADPQALDLWLDVDGARQQTGSTKTMIFGVAHLVHYISQFMSLQPGDIIATGTPPGVGAGKKPPVYLKPGQTMRLGVQGLGEQRQRVGEA
jgi:ureidoglycolate lyase